MVGEEREQEEEGGGWEDGRSVINWQTEGVWCLGLVFAPSISSLQEEEEEEEEERGDQLGACIPVSSPWNDLQTRASKVFIERKQFNGRYNSFPSGFNTVKYI